MGDRIAIRFVDDAGEKSVALFAHWAGPSLVIKATDFVSKLRANNNDDSDPLGRMEPSIVMVNFIVWLFKDKDFPIRSSYYLGKDGNDGDCSDNGCFDVNVWSGDAERV